MTFGESVSTVLKKKYATFEGRAARSEFWWFTLFSIVAQIAIQILTGVLAAISETLAVVGVIALLIFALGMIIPSIAVAVRRLHDGDRSGWWYLLILIPLIGPIVLLVFFCMKGTEGDNRFGADPLGSGVNPEAFA